MSNLTESAHPDGGLENHRPGRGADARGDDRVFVPALRPGRDPARAGTRDGADRGRGGLRHWAARDAQGNSMPVLPAQIRGRLMYGKFFASTFTGSMFGAGANVFAVWGYVIANTVDGRIELNPKLIASILGTPEAAVIQAITELCEPDPLSRNKSAEGRRLQREGQFQYRVTSHEVYRSIRNEEDRRQYNRVKQQESRARRQTVKRAVIDLSALSAHTEIEAEAEANTEEETKSHLGNSGGVNQLKDPLPRKNGGVRESQSVQPQNDAKGQEAAIFIDHYVELYAKHRNGARYHVKPSLDWSRVCDLLNTYPLTRLEKLAAVLLTTDEDWVQKTDRGIGVLVARASWCDDRLSAWEAQHGVKA